MSIPNLKYKTTLCKNWEEGTFLLKSKGTPCEKGPGCYFAHGQHQLRKIEENQQLIANRNTYLLHYQYSNNYKTVYCKFYAKGMYAFKAGQCKLGASCTFAHQKKQKRKIPKNPPYQQPPLPPFMPYNIPFFYPQFYNFGGQIHYGQNFSSFQNNQAFNEKEQDLNSILERKQNQPKSEQKKKPSIEEISTTEKSPKKVEDQKDQSQAAKTSSCFNIE